MKGKAPVLFPVDDQNRYIYGSGKSYRIYGIHLKLVVDKLYVDEEGNEVLSFWFRPV